MAFTYLSSNTIEHEHLPSSFARSTYLDSINSNISSSNFEYINMGGFAYESESGSVIPLERLFEALMLTTSFQNVVPQAIEIISGNGGPGTLKKIHFADCESN